MPTNTRIPVESTVFEVDVEPPAEATAPGYTTKFDRAHTALIQSCIERPGVWHRVTSNTDHTSTERMIRWGLEVRKLKTYGIPSGLSEEEYVEYKCVYARFNPDTPAWPGSGGFTRAHAYALARLARDYPEGVVPGTPDQASILPSQTPVDEEPYKLVYDNPHPYGRWLQQDEDRNRIADGQQPRHGRKVPISFKPEQAVELEPAAYAEPDPEPDETSYNPAEITTITTDPTDNMVISWTYTPDPEPESIDWNEIHEAAEKRDREAAETTIEVLTIDNGVWS